MKLLPPDWYRRPVAVYRREWVNHDLNLVLIVTYGNRLFGVTPSNFGPHMRCALWRGSVKLVEAHTLKALLAEWVAWRLTGGGIPRV